ncbi:MAG: helix-turn-helix transcriptional regulator [Dongiaceae bacterium]
MAEVAALVGDPTRAIILDQLMGGRALTATELALAAGVAAPTASGHLGKLVEAKLIAVLKQGRHRYYRLASPMVARMLEGIMEVAALEMPPRYRPRTPRDEALCLARSCYDHLAGRLAVAITDALIARGCIVLAEEGGTLTIAGENLIAEIGIDLDAIRTASKRPVCRACLDWTERRPHLSGRLGAAIARRCFDLGWLARRREGRALTITDAGYDGLRRWIGIERQQLAVEAAATVRTPPVATRSSAA